jgi:hypothetical protein
MDKLRLCTGENPDKTGVGGECAKKSIRLACSVPYWQVDIYSRVVTGLSFLEKRLPFNSSYNFSSLLILFFMSLGLGHNKFVTSALEKIERTVATGTEKCRR